MARSGIAKVGILVLVAMVIISSVALRASAARTLRPGYADGSSQLARGIEALLDGLYVEAIKTGGPSSGGKGHSFTNYVTNSGPGPGEGH